MKEGSKVRLDRRRVFGWCLEGCTDYGNHRQVLEAEPVGTVWRMILSFLYWTSGRVRITTVPEPRDLLGSMYRGCGTLFTGLVILAGRVHCAWCHINAI